MADQDLINALLDDRRRDRRWRNVRFFTWIFLVLLSIILVFAPASGAINNTSKNQGPYVSLVRLNGVIKAGADFSAKKVVPVLQRAFADKQSKGVVLVINSPGGSPVQASIIHDKILQLRKKYHKKVVVLGRDALASGAYLVATAANDIYVNKDTLTGSIGVIMSGFGFANAIQKLGITRRVFTAGLNKDRLDSFLPMSAADKAKISTVLNAVHQNFINDVLQGRKGRLKGNPKELFSGDFWTGQQAVKLGLADGTGNLWTILPQQFDVKRYKVFKIHKGLLAAFMQGMESSLKHVQLGLLNNTPQLQSVL